jgi:GNAT superfamily N-acetyltransferase
VAEPARGIGVGRQLISAALLWFDDASVKDVSVATVATLAHNVAALRAYQRGGFTVSAMDAWLHKWFP